jgi:hypothetical protein
MAGNGRPDKYKSHVEPHLDEIAQMCEYMTEKQIAETLGVSYSSFRDYKNKYPALNDTIKKGRKVLSLELRSILIQKAKGFTYTEKKIIKERDPETGNMIVMREEKNVKQALPDVAALNLALKNYDPDNWANDPQLLKLKKEELDYKKENMKNENW